MIIGIDGNEANVDKLVGVSVYTQNLLQYFAKVADKDTQFVIYLRDDPNARMPKENSYFHYKVVRSTFLWSQVFLPLELYQNKQIDVFFSPAHYSPRFCPVPLVVTIHDLSYFYFPDEFLKKDLFKLTNWTKRSIEKAKKIISVSKTTKKDIMKFYSVPDNKITVIYNGFEKEKMSNEKDDNVLEKFKLEKNKFILYVGTVQPRKNIEFLIQTFSAFHKMYADYKLVITGKKGWLYDKIFAKVQEYHLEDSVIFTDYIADEAVTHLYQNALCFVLPSLYEGFGIPILEAMSNNCPVISSHSSSLPEIGGDACLYFDPKNEKDLLDDLQLIKTDAATRKELVTKGKERIKLFSWEKCAQETLETIKSSIL